MKRALVFLLAAVLLTLSLASCGKPDPVVKESVSDTAYSITYYWGPPLKDFNETTVLQMKEAGFDIIPLQRFPDNPDALKEAVELIGKHGMSAAVTDSRITDLYKADKLKQAQIDAVVSKVVADYSGYDAIKEWILCDEPPMSKFNVVSKIVDAFRRIDPQRKTFINVLPVYATAEMMGTDSYETYLEGFCKIVKPDYI